MPSLPGQTETYKTMINPPSFRLFLAGVLVKLLKAKVTNIISQHQITQRHPAVGVGGGTTIFNAAPNLFSALVGERLHEELLHFLKLMFLPGTDYSDVQWFFFYDLILGRAARALGNQVSSIRQEQSLFPFFPSQQWNKYCRMFKNPPQH